MTKVISLIFSLIFISLLSFAQQDETTTPSIGRNSFFAELGGPGVLFSANLDHRFKASRLGLGGRIGIGFVTSSRDDFEPATNSYTYRDVTVVTIPIQINYIFGKGYNPHTFEAGAGLTVLSKGVDLFSYDNDSRSSILGTFSFMYRRQPVDGGFSWRIGFTPIVGSGYIQPSGAVSVGYNF